MLGQPTGKLRIAGTPLGPLYNPTCVNITKFIENIFKPYKHYSNISFQKEKLILWTIFKITLFIINKKGAYGGPSYETFICVPACVIHFFAPLQRRGGIIVLLMSVGMLVDQMVSADYLKYHLTQSLHISHVVWSWLVDDPYWFWGH